MKFFKSLLLCGLGVAAMSLTSCNDWLDISYELPKSFLAKTKVIKRAILTASASNLLLFTNYDGDPEVAAAGAGRGGSSSVGFDYCGVPATRQFAFGVNLTLIYSFYSIS